MKRPFGLLVGLMVGSSIAPAQGHDYFRNACFPGNLREDLGLDKVKQARGDGGQPGRRVVQ